MADGRCNSVQVTAQGQYTSSPAKTRPTVIFPLSCYPPPGYSTWGAAERAHRPRFAAPRGRGGDRGVPRGCAEPAAPLGAAGSAGLVRPVPNGWVGPGRGWGWGSDFLDWAYYGGGPGFAT